MWIKVPHLMNPASGHIEQDSKLKAIDELVIVRSLQAGKDRSDILTILHRGTHPISMGWTDLI
ncbi:hypothetical protein [Burkholderia vietnamiensis]|uniref:hypothetical protein n=1 Tax=Burkholderia vietnamiensis TaxID=60552 RepID=UPI00158C826E|nr:hypothetical protein [Burkholderia vietnamiensis]